MRAPTYTDQLAWDGRFLRVLDPSILTRVDRPHISHSTAVALASCPARLVFDKTAVGESDPFAPTQIGSATHKVLERLYNLDPDQRGEEAAASILLALSQEAKWHALLGGDPVRTLQWTSTVMENVKGDLTVEKNPEDVNVYATEFKVQTTLNSLPFLGFVDRIDILDDNTLRISDYKTGADRSKKPGPGMSDEHGDQIRAYKVLLEHVLAQRGETNSDGEPWRVSVGRDIYVSHGKQRRVSVSKKAELTQAINRLDTGWQTLRRCVDAAQFECKVSPLCGWCLAVNSCPLARAAGKTDKKGTAYDADSLDIHTLLLDRPHSIEQGAHETPECLTTDGEAEDREPGLREDTTKEQAMTTNETTTNAWREGKPWDGPLIDGHVNMGSSEMQNAGVYTSMAIKILQANYMSTDPANVRAMHATLEALTRRVQKAITGGDDPGTAAATRARFSVNSAMRLRPAPFGNANENAWAEWAKEVAHIAEILLRMDVDAVEHPLDSKAQPWRALAAVRPMAYPQAEPSGSALPAYPVIAQA